MTTHKSKIKKFLKVLGITLLSVFGLALILFVILIFVGKEEAESPFSLDFPDDRDTVMIPFDYSTNGHIVTKVIIHDDTLNFVMDTGASLSHISLKNISKSAYKKTFLDRMGSTSTDAVGVKKREPRITLKQLTWDNITVNNLKCSVYDEIEGIIGGDLLRNFCVKVDNDKNLLVLSEKLDSIPEHFIEVPFIERANCPYLFGRVGTDADSCLFLFDTGWGSQELVLNDATQQLQKPVIHWKEPIYTAFVPKGYYSPDSTIAYYLSEFEFGAKVYKNTILNSVQTEQPVNIIGSVFARRFKSYTIDYPNKKIYFELPDAEKVENLSGDPLKDSKKNENTTYLVMPEDARMDFSGKEISAVNQSHGNLLFRRINSLGLQFKIHVEQEPERNDFIFVSALAVNEANRGINIGDTLVGIDTVLFIQRVISIADSEKLNFHLESDFSQQGRLFFNTFYKAPKVDFHFIKNGKIKTVHAERDNLAETPVTVYSYGKIESFEPYYKLNYKGEGSYNIHFTWWSLLGRQFEVIEYKNGVKTVEKN